MLCPYFVASLRRGRWHWLDDQANHLPVARIRHIAKTLTAVADLLDSYRPPTTPS